MGVHLIEGMIAVVARRGRGVPGLRVDLWASSPTGDHRVTTTLTDRAGHFTAPVDDATHPQGVPLVAVVTDRHGTEVHRGALATVRGGAARPIRIRADALEAHLADPILIDPAAPPLDPDGLVLALRQLMSAALPDWGPEALDQVFTDARCPIPGTGTFAALGREALGVLDGQPRAGVAFASLLGVGGPGPPFEPQGTPRHLSRTPCPGCGGGEHALAVQDAGPTSRPPGDERPLTPPGGFGDSFVPVDHSLPMIAAAALLEAGGLFGRGLLGGVVNRLCTLERLGHIHLLALELAPDQAALGPLLGGLLGPGGPFPECPPVPQLPDLPVPAPCEPLRRCADAARGAFSGVQAYVISAVSKPVACPGDTISLTGSGFGSTPGLVSFGGVTATASSWSDTSVTVTVPAGARNPLALILPARQYLICGRLLEARPSGSVTATFEIGVPVIEAFFAGSPWDNPYCVEPGKPIPLQWRVSGANNIRVEVRSQIGAIVAVSDPAPAHGIFATLVAPQTNTTTTWTARITATGACGGTTQAQVAIRITRSPGLAVSGIEVTQAIQYFQSALHLTDSNDRGPDNSLALAAGKSAYVRAYPLSVRDPSFNGGILGQIDGTLTVERLGPTGAWQAVPNVTPTGAPLFTPTGLRPIQFRASDTYDNRRSNLNRSLNWIIPASEMNGRLRISVSLQTGEEVCGNQPATGSVEVNLITRQLRVAAVRIGYAGPPSATSPPGTPPVAFGAPPLVQPPPPAAPVANVVGTAGYVMATYPINAQLTVRDAGTVTATLPLDDAQTGAGQCTQNWGSLLALVQTARTNDGNQPGFFYYGFIANGTPVGVVIGCEGGTAAGFVGNGQTMAHELGHALGRPHAPCGNVGAFDAGYPFYEPHDAPPPPPIVVSTPFGSLSIPGQRTSASIGEYGLDIRNGSIPRPPTTHDFMSYCGPGWMSIRGHLLSVSAPLLGAPLPMPWAMEGGAMTAASTPGPVEVVSVIGQIGEDGRLHMESVARVTTHTDLPGWRLHDAMAELLDDTGTVLAATHVMVRETTAGCGCDDSGDPGGSRGPSPRASVFQAFLTPAAAAVALRVRVADDVHDERKAHGVSPRVAVTECTVEDDSVRLAWRVEADPAASLDVWIQASERGRGRWRGVKVGVRDERSATIALSELPAGSTRLRVLLHDGFSTAQATGPVIELPAREPVVSIVHPADGAVLDPDAPGLAWAAAHDDHGAPPAEGDVTWLLDGDTIGTGIQLPLPALEPGHDYALEARSGGTTAVVNIRTSRRRR